MDRKSFIKQCGFTCLSGTVLASILESCGPTRSVAGNISKGFISIPGNSFEIKKAGTPTYKKYLIVENEGLQYPICVFRFSETDYSALLMQCTHQGTELQVFGDTLQCPAHGSEFDNRGNVKNGPAESHLRTLPVTINNGQINISLSKS